MSLYEVPYSFHSICGILSNLMKSASNCSLIDNSKSLLLKNLSKNSSPIHLFESNREWSPLPFFDSKCKLRRAIGDYTNYYRDNET